MEKKKYKGTEDRILNKLVQYKFHYNKSIINDEKKKLILQSNTLFFISTCIYKPTY